MPADVHNSEPEDSPTKPVRRWPRIVGWIVIWIGVFVLLIAAAVTVLLHNRRFHNYLLALAEKKASAALGVPVRVNNFVAHLSGLGLDVYGVTIYGAQPYPDPPLLEVRHIGLGVRIVSILHRKWYLDRLRIDDPVARVFTDMRGVSNLPNFNSGGGGHTNIFQIGIRHVLLDHGVAYYNDKKKMIDLDLRDVDFLSAFDPLPQKYSGNLRYAHGLLRIGNFSPVRHDLEAQFEATPTAFRLTRTKISSGSLQFLFSATLANYSRPVIQGRYQAALNGDDLRQILRDPSLPAGIVFTSGAVQYREVPNVPAFETAVVNGDLRSARLQVKTGKINAQIRDLAAHYALKNGNLTVNGIRAGLLGGTIAGSLEIRNISGKSRSSVNAKLHEISLQQIQQIVPKFASSRNIALAGKLNADASASWGKTFRNLVAHANVGIHASVSRAAGSGAATVPLDASIHGAYFGATKQLALSHSDFQMPQTSLTLDGTVSDRSNLAVKFQSGDLTELEPVADLMRTPKPGQSAEPLGLAGTASFTGSVRGYVFAPHLAGKFIASNFQLKNTKWRKLQANIEASPSFARLENADLEPAEGGKIAFNASVQLTQWSFTKNSAIQAQLHASQINIADVTKLAGMRTPIAGTFEASVSIHGTELNPMGQGHVVLTRAHAYGQPIQSATFNFAGGNGTIQGDFIAHAAAGTIRSKAKIRPETKSYEARIDAKGIELSELQILKTYNVNARGVLTVTGSGQGTFANPQFSAAVQIPSLAVQQQSMRDIQLQVAVADRIATVNLSSEAVNTSIQAHAKIDLSGDYPAEARLDTRNIPLQPLFAVYAPSEASGIQGETELHATLRGPLKNKKLLQAHIAIPILKVDYNNAVHLAAASPIHIDYTNGVLNLQRAAIRGTDTDLQIQGSIPIEGRAPASLLLLGTVNLQLAQLFNPDVKSSGELRFNINSYGASYRARADPNIEGQVKIVSANFTDANLPIGLQNGNGTLTLTKNRLNIDSLQANVGGGTLTAQGGVTYRPQMQFDLGVSAKGIRMLYPQGMREEVAANLRLNGTRENALLGGRVQIENLSFTPDFDLTNFAGQFSGGISPPPSQGFAQNVRLNLAVSTTNNLNLVSRTLSVDGTANLQVRGTAAQPVVLGRVNLTNGDIIFNGNRFTLSGGTVEFVNPAETQPVVNLALNTTIQQYNIHLRFNGPMDLLRTNYSSDPSLPAADIINLLAFGQTTEASAANPTPGDQAAMSAVASQVSSQITSRVAKVAGISQLSINPVLTGGSTQGPAGAIVTVQQRVTGNLFVTFSTNVTSTQNQVIMGQYRLSPRVAVSATRDQNGGFAFDTIFKKTW